MLKNSKFFQKYNCFYKYRKKISIFKKYKTIKLSKGNKVKLLACMNIFPTIIKKNRYEVYLHSNNFFYKNINWYNNTFAYEYEIRDLFRKELQSFFYVYLKLRFYGKTFKWLFFKRKLRFKVQKAHRSYILFKSMLIKRKKKLKLKFRLLSLKDKKRFWLCIKEIKPVNLFTKKGFRILKTVLRKKQGKISTYV